MTSRTIRVDALARVEGEGALYLRLQGEQIQELKFRIYEPPRFFEALLQGRAHSDAPDISARICGICPMAYIISACQAMEQAADVSLSGALQSLRRIAYCGEWIESHVLHAFLLHAPDFLGYADAISLSRDHPEVVQQALRLKQLGNRILEVIGGRAVHPVNFRVGGLYGLPQEAQLQRLAAQLEQGMETALGLARFTATLDFPELDHDYTCVSLRHADVYPIEAGRIVSNRGLDIAVEDFERHFDELHEAHSTALIGVSTTSSQPYLVGPIARYNNNHDRLQGEALACAEALGLGERVGNPFRSIQVRMVETLYALEEAIRLLRAYRAPPLAALEVRPSGRGCGCTEAPRGICYHRYDLDAEGYILQARIMPPTAQNQRQIEQDLRAVVQAHLALPDERLQWLCEQAIRNYDPCISCATHFLKLTIERD